MTHSDPAPAAWPVALAAATVMGTLATACMTPFVALATLAAATMPRGRAIATIAAIWAANQTIGFCAMGYPPTAHAFAWGGAIGGASLAALMVAAAVLKGLRDMAAAPLLAAFVVAFAGYELLLYGFALVAGGTGTFTPGIVARILANDAAWLVGLAALYHLLTRAAPGLFGPAPALRLA